MKNIQFIGWNYEEENGKTIHDKIWGVIKLDGQLMTFWGKRGAKTTFKKPPESEVTKLIKQKKQKYKEVTTDILNKNDIEWQRKFEEDIVLAQLGNFFHSR